jgi:hypothetical protein
MSEQPSLLEVPATRCPDLAVARRQLDALQAEHDRRIAEADEAGCDVDESSHEWRNLCRNLARALSWVAALERREMEGRG